MTLKIGCWLNEPSSAIGLIDSPGVHIFRSHLCLPPTDFCSLNGRVKEDTTVSIRFLFELYRKLEILEVLITHQVTVLFVRSAFTNQFTLFNKPLFCSVYGPTR